MPHTEIRPCSPRYWEFVRLLRNNPSVQAGFIEPANISAEQQRVFMRKNSKWYVIAVQDGEPMGYLGLIGPSRTEITYCVEPRHQGVGVGSALVQYAYDNIEGAWAKIFTTNTASIKAIGRIFPCRRSVGEFLVFAKSETDLQRGVSEMEKAQ